MAYNKSKFVEAAQKLLNQGKVAQAIAEYQQILKFEPRDQVTLMTIGELYIRQGETFQAIDYFERLAQIFVGDGFLTKAIAVYKRIAKLAPEEIRPLEKLADLYVQQGVMSEARPLFLQLAEIHLKNSRQTEAIGLLKKLLQAEPDNLRIQIRLADLYQAMGQPKDAVEAYVSAAQRALARGDHAECDKLAEKALKIEPQNLAAVIVRARSFSTQGNLNDAAKTLEGVPDLEKGGEQTELLLDLYLKNSKWDQANALALRVFDADAKNFGPLQKVVEALLESGQPEKAMPILDRVRIPMIDAGEHEVICKLLTELAARLPGRVQPLEWLVETYGRTSDSFRLPDALAQLGDALVAAKQFDRAKAILEQLVDREPESDSAKRKLNDCLRKMGLLAPEDSSAPVEESMQAELTKAPAPKVRPSAEPSAPVPAAEASAAAAEAALDEDTQRFIAQSLTDVDLFASYGLTQKAIGLLEAILRRAPRHTPTLEKLLDFVLGAGDDRRTAELASQLEHIHRERGDSRSADRFGELRRRFQRAAGLTDEELAAAAPAEPAPAVSEPEEIGIAEIDAQPLTPPAPPQAPEVREVTASQPISAAHEEEVHEVDLSDEWASLLEAKAASPAARPAPPPAQTAAAPPPSAAAEEFAIPIDAAPEAVPESLPVQEEGHPFAEISSELAAPEVGHKAEPVPIETHEIDLGEILSASPASVAPKHEPPAQPAHQQPAAAASDSEFELDQDYELVIEPEALVPAYDQKPPETPIVPHEPEPVAHNAAAAPPAGGFASDQFLSDLANEIDSLGLTPTFSQPDAPAKAQPPATLSSDAIARSAESGPLKEVFEEFRAELGEMGAEDEDLETHYSLGIAFREMGLLEEAISEFQKVAKANERGRPFRYAMQCCTLLGLAFMEKGQPGIAAIWYERALETPGVEPESILALRYDLGIAQESAGEPEAALKSFSKVYAMNIDYRDVAERIA
ncbi:MAG TPA: tetratricopeptide repeat protein, partial [Candidatus Dormibacteraeota bacterium]|nr:tetratricopeptide repeat protein [Candidatus Dormibacteraeota bacterium]